VLAGDAADPVLQPRDVLHLYSVWDLRDRYQVSINGSVREPGTFDWRKGMTLRDLVLKAGGLEDSADILHAEVSRLSEKAVTSRDLSTPPESTVDVIRVELGETWLTDSFQFQLQPHDHVAVRKLPWWQLHRTVTIQGEVSYPGVYTLDRPDERLSALIARAGGLKPTAFASGARIVRDKDAVGNVALDLAEAVSHSQSKHDMVLEHGDVILVPSTPYTVKVTGAVGFPTSVIWEPGLSLGDYVSRAGGYADGSDKWKTHVVYPNGMSKQIRRIWNDPGVMAGSTVVVPTKKPSDDVGRLATLKEIASIFASVATVWLVIDRTN
jgi:protein involved in polysaccharide export with SLBB domain